jgi:Ca2+-binding RTX toxin-like protein
MIAPAAARILRAIPEGSKTLASTVTIHGSNNVAIPLTFDATSNVALAQQIATFLNSEIAAGKLVTSSDAAPPLPRGVSGAYVQATTEVVKLPPGYTTDLVTKPGPAIVLGSGKADPTILSDEHTSLTFVASAGSGTVVAGGGDNRLAISGSAADNWSLNTGSGNDVILALGAVNATIAPGGGKNAIQLGSGHDLVISAGRDSIAGGSGQSTIDASNATSDFVQGEKSDLLFIGGSGGATILGGTGSDTYFGSAAGPVGEQLIKGGSAGSNLLFAGDGAATLVGGGNNDQLFAYGSANQVLNAGSGNETLSAAFSSGNDTLAPGLSNGQLIGGTGSDTFLGGGGNATITAGSGRDVYAFINHQAGGNDVVQGVFDPTAIQIHLQGYDPSAIHNALASQRTSNGSVTIGLEDGTKITFQDVSSLNRSNFT